MFIFWKLESSHMSFTASAQHHKTIFRPDLAGETFLCLENVQIKPRSASSVNVNVGGNKRNINIETREGRQSRPSPYPHSYRPGWQKCNSEQNKTAEIMGPRSDK